jgi:hypothetical protein
MPRRIALTLFAAAFAVFPRLGSATTADNICSPAADPCLLNSVLTVSPGSTLDFGARKFQIGAAGTLNVNGGDTLTIKAGTVELLAGALIRKVPASSSAPTVSIQTTADILMRKSGSSRSKIDVSADDAGGVITLEANGNVSLDGDLLAKGTTIESDAGTLDISAGGDVSITGDITLFAGSDGVGGEITITATGSIVANGTVVDASGGLEGGSIDLEAGTNLSTTAKLDVSGDGAGSDGGFVTLVAQGNLTMGGLLNADGSGSVDFGGFGGDIELSAVGTTRISNKIDISGGSPDGEGGTADISGGVDLVLTGQLVASGPTGQGFGGTLLLSAVNVAQLAELIDLHGGNDGGGGYLSVQSSTEVRAQSEINANGDGGYVLLSTLHEPDPTDPTQNFVTGKITASGNLHSDAAPTGFGGQISIQGCDIVVPAGSTLDTLGDTALNLLQASGQLTVGGTLTADGGSGGSATNRFEYRDAGKTPIIQPGASITPSAVAALVPTLPPCGAVCGNGVVETGEQCDKGAANGTPGSGCNVLCKTAEVCGTASGPTCIPCADDTECHPLGICGGSQCKAGVCTAVPVPVCDDGNPCTNDRCDGSAGCVHDAQSGAGVAGCDDGNVCNGAETCTGGTCTPGTPPPTDDNDPCTDDDGVCDPTTGTPHPPKVGFASAICRLDAIDAALRTAAVPGDISDKVRAKLDKALAALRGKIGQAQGATGKKRVKMLKAAGKQITKLVKLIGAASKKSQIKSGLADTITRAATGATNAVDSLRTTST